MTLRANVRPIHLGNFQIPNAKNSTLDATATSDPEGSLVTFLPGETLAGFKSITIIDLNSALTQTVNVNTLRKKTLDEASEANYSVVQLVPGTDLVVAADKAIVIENPGQFPALILMTASGDEGAARNWAVYGVRY